MLLVKYIDDVQPRTEPCPCVQTGVVVHAANGRFDHIDDGAILLRVKKLELYDLEHAVESLFNNAALGVGELLQQVILLIEFSRLLFELRFFLNKFLLARILLGHLIVLRQLLTGTIHTSLLGCQFCVQFSELAIICWGVCAL